MTSTATEGTRDRVLSVAMELLAERGYAGTSTREVCERVGFTKPALYYYFRTKDELLEALVEPVLADLTRLVDGSEVSAAPAARRAALVGYVDVVCAHVELLRVLADDPSVRGRSVLAPFIELTGRLEKRLAGTEHPDRATLIGVRTAVGGARNALLRTSPIDDEARDAVIAAACGALRLPPPRTAGKSRND
jgi:AcrR family transcriptional regulator